MRTFIGTDFNKESKEKIAAIQTTVREQAERGRFKYIGNFHLTIKFLGEIEDKRSVDIAKALRGIASRHERFSLQVDRLGCFDGRDSIHALWLGFSGELAKLHGLYMDIEDSMHGIGLKREIKPYTPHITIAQDLKLKLPFEALQERISLEGIKPIEIREIALIKSEEKAGKRIYTPVSAFPLK